MPQSLTLYNITASLNRGYNWLNVFEDTFVDAECWGDFLRLGGESRRSWLNSDLLASVCGKSLSLSSLSCRSSCLLVITLSAIRAGNISSWFYKYKTHSCHFIPNDFHDWLFFTVKGHNTILKTFSTVTQYNDVHQE